jgi:hypothetical protein
MTRRSGENNKMVSPCSMPAICIMMHMPVTGRVVDRDSLIYGLGWGHDTLTCKESNMRKFAITLAAAGALAVAPALAGHDTAEAGWSNWGKFLGAMAVTALIVGAVRAGQSHCHPGYGCHAHVAAGPYHYHDAYGRIVYNQPAPVAPAPVQPSYGAPAYGGGGGYSQAHYNYCASKYRSYDPGSNTYQPFGNVPRRPCYSPY